MTACVLVSGFEPFGGDTRNPSMEVCAALAGRRIGGHVVEALTLPTAFGVAARQLLSSIQRLQPAVVIATGLAGDRSAVTVERFALNFIDARIPDNRGKQPRERAVIAGAPLALASTLPVSEIVAHLRQTGIPAAPSLSAGSFVCNEVFFRAAHTLAGSATRVGFIHLPYASEHIVDRPQLGGMPLVSLIDALELAIAVALQPRAARARTRQRERPSA